MDSEPVVYVIDDDRAARESVCALVRSMGFAARPFASAEEFLEQLTPDCRGCVVTDVRMEGLSGDQLQARLNQQEIFLPIIVLTAYARTPLTVKVMREGAVTLLEKPYEEDELWDAIRKALQIDAAQYSQHERRQEIRRRFEELSPQEVEVLKGVVAGKPNKQIARQLDVSLRTVESRRHDLFEKMGVRSVAELVRQVIEADLDV